MIQMLTHGMMENLRQGKFASLRRTSSRLTSDWAIYADHQP